MSFLTPPILHPIAVLNFVARSSGLATGCEGSITSV